MVPAVLEEEDETLKMDGSRWIYIQQPASIFNLSSSSSSAAGTTCPRLLLLARFAVKRYSTVGQAIPPTLHTSCSSPPTAEPHRTRTN